MMKSAHLRAALLRAWLQGRLRDEELLRPLLTHLLESCSHCRHVWNETVGPLAQEEEACSTPYAPRTVAPAPLQRPSRVAAEEALENALSTAIDRVLKSWPSLQERTDSAASKVRAEEIVTQLEALNSDQRLAVLEPLAAAFPTSELALALSRRSRQGARQSPGDARHWADLALVAAQDHRRGILLDVRFQTDTREASRSLSALDAEALAMATVGNAERLGGEFPEARKRLEEAETLRLKGSGDPLLWAEMLSLRASLQRDFGELPLAKRGALKAALLYRRCGHRHETGRQLIQVAAVQRDEGRTLLAVHTMQAALSYLDFEQEPALRTSVMDNLALLQAEAGNPQAALETLRQNPPSARATRRSLLHHHWTEARILQALGSEEGAMAILEVVRRGFEELEDLPNATVTTLDLALIHCRLGRPDDVLRLASEALPMLLKMELHHYAAEAFQLMRDAVAVRRLNQEVLRAMLNALQATPPRRRAMLSTGDAGLQN